MKAKINTLAIVLFLGFLSVILAGCGDGGGGSSSEATYRFTLTNITHAQPLSPMAVVLHRPGFEAWKVGESASLALEELAEGGSPESFIAAAAADPLVTAESSGASAISPGNSDSIELTVRSRSDAMVSLAAMLVNTNDAFTGINAGAIGALQTGQSVSFMLPAYDAGTEANTEEAVTVPGPAAGGEGFNPDRDDQDIVTLHPGVVTTDDGLAISGLSQNHRWDNPVAKFTVTRID